MNILINEIPYELPREATLADAIAALAALQPFAAAVNRTFVPRSAYAAHVLNPDDRIDVIRPVTGG